jgi:hypothetical protein
MSLAKGDNVPTIVGGTIFLNVSIDVWFLNALLLRAIRGE